MIYLTIINALPVKQRMKNAFLENHIFTEYNLLIFINIRTRKIVGVDVFAFE